MKIDYRAKYQSTLLQSRVTKSEFANFLASNVEVKELVHFLENGYFDNINFEDKVTDFDFEIACARQNLSFEDRFFEDKYNKALILIIKRALKIAKRTLRNKKEGK